MMDEDEHVVEEDEDEDEEVLSFCTNTKIYSFSYLEMLLIQFTTRMLGAKPAFSGYPVLKPRM